MHLEEVKSPGQLDEDKPYRLRSLEKANIISLRLSRCVGMTVIDILRF